MPPVLAHQATTCRSLSTVRDSRLTRLTLSLYLSNYVRSKWAAPPTADPPGWPRFGMVRVPDFGSPRTQLSGAADERIPAQIQVIVFLSILKSKTAEFALLMNKDASSIK